MTTPLVPRTAVHTGLDIHLPNTNIEDADAPLRQKRISLARRRYVDLKERVSALLSLFRGKLRLTL